MNTVGIPIFGNKAVKELFPYVRLLPPNRTAEVGGGWKVIPFNVPHTHADGAECQNYAYLIKKDGITLLYATDYQYIGNNGKEYSFKSFNVNHFLIAINYTELEDDGQGNIHHVLEGHSSLDTALEFLKVNVTDECRSILACHVSERNADELKIIEGLVNTAPRVRNIAICKKGITYSL